MQDACAWLVAIMISVTSSASAADLKVMAAGSQGAAGRGRFRDVSDVASGAGHTEGFRFHPGSVAGCPVIIVRMAGIGAVALRCSAFAVSYEI
jgi:hypothetical protein